jgi:hydrogenase/urease accessory protein HupE
VVQIDHSFLREFDTWSASCVLRIRQVNDAAFDTALLTREKTAEFNCVWPPSTTGPIDEASSDSIQTNVRIWPTIRAYTAHGIMHILTGYDHLLFVSALVLAAVSLWDLIKVVSAFTLAHTLTLTLSVFNIVTLGERVVEPMIAASIVFVAVQNIFWPERSRGWTRLAIAFAFGLFHGLGFAGGLKEAMSQMPPVALWAALAAFSLGVEIGHQVVVIPLVTVLYTVRHWKAADPGPRLVVVGRLRMVCSAAISVAGCYFLVHAIW